MLSEPETRVKRVEVYVDQNGEQTDEPVPGAKKEVTYQRERVYRRQTINEKIEEALADADEQTVKIGVDATTVAQLAGRTTGGFPNPNKNAYALASADLFFAAKLAQYTIFFADIVGLSGAPPDREIPALTLLNGYTARLVEPERAEPARSVAAHRVLRAAAGAHGRTARPDQLLRSQRRRQRRDARSSSATRSSTTRCSGWRSTARAWPPISIRRTAFNFKFGFQQSNPDATSLSDSIYSLAEVGYTCTPFSLPEGTLSAVVPDGQQRAGRHPQSALGVSLDQKLSPDRHVCSAATASRTDRSDRDRFYSAGVSFQHGLVFNPLDTWGVGYAQMDLAIGRHGDT